MLAACVEKARAEATHQSLGQVINALVQEKVAVGV
jgi:hypothetical protein